jgi:hypothetical protein
MSPVWGDIDRQRLLTPATDLPVVNLEIGKAGESGPLVLEKRADRCSVPGSNSQRDADRPASGTGRPPVPVS